MTRLSPPRSPLAGLAEIVTDTHVDFYGGPFSNFADSPIRMSSYLDGIERYYITVEHWFQAEKARTVQDHERVRLQPGPGSAKHAGRSIRLRDDWEAVKYDVMVDGLRAKFNARDRRSTATAVEYGWQLLVTGDREIREDSPTDFVWGYRSANGRDEGSNLLGKALMQVRDEVMSHVDLLGVGAWAEDDSICWFRVDEFPGPVLLTKHLRRTLQGVIGLEEIDIGTLGIARVHMVENGPDHDWWWTEVPAGTAGAFEAWRIDY